MSTAVLNRPSAVAKIDNMDRSVYASVRILAGFVLLVVLLACAFTYWDIEQDREAMLETTANFADSLSESMEGHIEAALRDASNAALSAALLIERSGGIEQFADGKRLHGELKRELWDEGSTARLIVADANGAILSTSTHFPAPKGTVAGVAGSQWLAQSATQRAFGIGKPQRSLVGGELVLPFVCDIHDSKGAVIGTARAELRIDHFIASTSRSPP